MVVNANRLSFGLVLLFSASLVACSDESTRPVEEQGFTGILEMNIRCEIVGGDTTDFQPRPGASNYSLIGACPNPTDGTTTIKFQLPQADSVWLLVYDGLGRPPIDTLYNQLSAAGSFGIIWTFDGPDGIYRVVMRTASGFESYGDVQFDENWTPSN